MKIDKRQIPSDAPSAPGVSGIGTAASVAPSNTLLLNSSATNAPLPSGAAPSLAPGVTITTGSSAPSTSSTDVPVTSETPVSSSGSSISMGAVIGICVGVFATLAVLLFLVLRYTKRARESALRAYHKNKRRMTLTNNRNSRGNLERRKSGREMWMKMDDSNGEHREKDQETLADLPAYNEDAERKKGNDAMWESDGKTIIERSVTVKSGKSSKTFKSIGYGVGLGLSNTFTTSDAPPQLQFTDSDMGTGEGFTRSTAPFARGNDPVSWDASTVADDSFLSLKHASGSGYSMPSGSLSPSIVQVSQTPPATERVHRWEEAEVVSPDGDDAYGGFDNVSKPKHPYATATPVKNSRRSEEASLVQPPPVVLKSNNPFLDQNPFNESGTSFIPSPGLISPLSMYSMPATPATSSISTSDGQGERERENSALASLIAALNISPDEALKRLSAAQHPTHRQSNASYLSKYSDGLGEDGIEKFPLPPTDFEHHRP